VDDLLVDAAAALRLGGQADLDGNLGVGDEHVAHLEALVGSCAHDRTELANLVMAASRQQPGEVGCMSGPGFVGYVPGDLFAGGWSVTPVRDGDGNLRGRMCRAAARD
jgi:hypothetical protein